MNAPARLLFAFTIGLALAAPAGSQGKPGKGLANPMDARAWQIGPITPTRNYSVNMPLAPSPHRDGWYFDFPQPRKAAGHVHYVTFVHGPLSPTSRIVLRYRVEAAPGVRILPTNHPNLPSILSIYFQRRGDNWSGRGKHETYRWWSTFKVHRPITPGTHELSVRLDQNWTAVGLSSAANNPQAFRDAIRNAERVGFSFGGGDGYGHGVYATGPARFVVTGFEVIP